MRPETVVSSPKYRPDIDGLRAIAVGLVIAYHATPWLKGGFIGVDVFFVISGFLIGSLILAELDRGTFSLALFYNRRVRRILPALIVVLVATTVLAGVFLFPSDFTRFGHGLAAAALSFSNIFFASKDSYFTIASSSEPLLHTWSLAVEEQFYLLFPLYLLALHRFLRGQLRLAVAVTAACSLIFSAVWVFLDQPHTFYYMHARAWELLLGTLVALRAYPSFHSARTRNAVAISGLALIGLSSVLLARVEQFPGLAAFPPCLGAAMIIASGNVGTNVVARVLALRPVVFIGLLSYSLYLWHWPLIVFVKQYTFATALTTAQMVGVIALTFVLALISWYFVERPCRQARPRHLTVFGAAAGSVAAIAAGGSALVAWQGIPGRFSPEIQHAASYVDFPHDAYYRKGICFIGKGSLDESRCLQHRDSSANVLLLGDSYAAQLWHGLAQTLRKTNVLQATVPGCKPLLPPPGDRRTGACRELRSLIYTDFLIHRRVDQVILAADWKPQDLAPLARVLDWAKAHRIAVLLIGPVIYYDAPLPYLLARGLQRHQPTLAAQHRVSSTPDIDRRLAALAAEKGVRYGSVYRVMCPHVAGPCMEYDPGGAVMQWDRRHLTAEGSVYVVDALNRQGLFGLVESEGERHRAPIEHETRQRGG